MSVCEYAHLGMEQQVAKSLPAKVSPDYWEKTVILIYVLKKTDLLLIWSLTCCARRGRMAILRPRLFACREPRKSL